jgi:hypothetical protein
MGWSRMGRCPDDSFEAFRARAKAAAEAARAPFIVFEGLPPVSRMSADSETQADAGATLGKYAEQVAARVVKRACEGDMCASRLVLDRIAPPRRGRPVRLKLPGISDAASVMVAQALLVSAVAAGKLTAEEAEPLSSMLAAYLKTVETVDIDRRLRELESKSAVQK